MRPSISCRKLNIVPSQLVRDISALHNSDHVQCDHASWTKHIHAYVPSLRMRRLLLAILDDALGMIIIAAPGTGTCGMDVGDCARSLHESLKRIRTDQLDESVRD